MVLLCRVLQVAALGSEKTESKEKQNEVTVMPLLHKTTSIQLFKGHLVMSHANGGINFRTTFFLGPDLHGCSVC